MKKILLLSALLILAPVAVFAAGEPCDPAAAVRPSLCNPIGGGGEIDLTKQSDVMILVGRLVTAVGVIVGTLTILMVVLSGLRMVVSAADPEQVKKGKEGLKYALGGFVISILAFVIVTAIEQFIGRDYNSGRVVGGNRPSVFNPLRGESFRGFVMDTILPNFFAVLGILAILMIIVSGFRYVMSAGNEEMAKKGKEGLLWAVIGLAIVLLAYVLVAATNKLLGGS